MMFGDQFVQKCYSNVGLAVFITCNSFQLKKHSCNAFPDVNGFPDFLKTTRLYCNNVSPEVQAAYNKLAYLIRSCLLCLINNNCGSRYSFPICSLYNGSPKGVSLFGRRKLYI